MEITKNLQTIERSLKAIKEAEFRINKLWGKTSSGKLDNSLYIIESSKIREEIKKALAAVDAIKAEEFKFLNENILPVDCKCKLNKIYQATISVEYTLSRKVSNSSSGL